MQPTLRSLPRPDRARAIPHVVDAGRFRPSRADALHEAHAALQAAEENLRQLAAAHARGRPAGSRPPLFRRQR
ncbi:MAG TPA: hypothetical protein VHI93_02460 [Candidatus Thermoplasmatota archaeon]|nr:hypothetical protein [Candidatus Thermoplasmatota archaeon]